MLIIPKLSGAFDRFSHVEEIPLDNIKRWIKFQIEEHILENFIANRLLYPQTIPMNEQEMEVDLAILREAIRLNAGQFYNPVKLSLVIPEEFTSRFQPFLKLVMAMVDVLPIKDITRIYIKSWVATRLAGSVTIPKNLLHPDINMVTLGEKKIPVKPYSFSNFPSTTRNQLLIVDSFHANVAGGEFGVFLDLRIRGTSNP